MPTVTVRASNPDEAAKPADAFPLDHVSASSMILFSTNPVLFKIKKLNRDTIDSTTNVSAVIGKAFHHAMETYYDPDRAGEEAAAIKATLEVGANYMAEYPEGWIAWSKDVPTRQDAIEKVAFAITEYVKASKYGKETTIACEDEIKSEIDVEWRGQRLRLPAPLKGFIDRVTRRKDTKLCVRDYKTCRSFSDLDKIDGGKIIQAVEYYFLAYAKYGEPPHSMTFEEVKDRKSVV